MLTPLTSKQWDHLIAELKDANAERRLEQVKQDKNDNPLTCPICGSHIKVVDDIDNYPHGMRIESIAKETENAQCNS